MGTILITRIALYVRPTASPIIRGFRLHHYMYGIVIGIIGLIISNILVFAIGLGLFVDEIPSPILAGKTYSDYMSRISIIGLCILSIIVFLLRNQIVVLIR